MSSFLESTGRRRKKDPTKDTAGIGKRSAIEESIFSLGQRLENLLLPEDETGSAKRTKKAEEN